MCIYPYFNEATVASRGMPFWVIVLAGEVFCLSLPLDSMLEFWKILPPLLSFPGGFDTNGGPLPRRENHHTFPLQPSGFPPSAL
jgi:hypothetical protein